MTVVWLTLTCWAFGASLGWVIGTAAAFWALSLFDEGCGPSVFITPQWTVPLDKARSSGA